MEGAAAADLDIRQLVRRLCKNIASQEVIAARCDPDLAHRLQPQLEDTAHSVLLGLHPEAAPPYVPPDAREEQVATGIAAAAQQLRQAGYPGLAFNLEAATASLTSFAHFQLLGSITEAETGATPVLPLTQHASLLGLLLGLAGSRPSLRQQRFTFQLEPTFQLQQGPATAVLDSTSTQLADSSAAAAGAAAQTQAAASVPLSSSAFAEGTSAVAAAAAAAAAVPLSNSVFEEAPDPHALTDGSRAVAVLLPSELGLPTEAHAGSEDLQDLAVGLESRPVWQPTAASSLRPPSSASWLAVPPSLLQLQQDGRRGAPPAPLGLPLSLLSMSDEPGSCTVFSKESLAAWEAASPASDVASADSVHPHESSPGANGRNSSLWTRHGGSSSFGSGAVASEVGLKSGRAAGERHPRLSAPLWSLEEAELARQALLALQGVASCLLRLQALIATPGALPRRSIAGLLQKLVAAGELRQRLHEFVVAFSGSASTSLTRSSAKWPSRLGATTSRSSSSGAPDPTQQAFAVAVSQVLQRQSAALQQLEQEQGSSWVEGVAVGGAPGRRFLGRTPTLLQVALHTRRLQLQLRTLADLCWCWEVDESDDSMDEGEAEHLPAAEADMSGAQTPAGQPQREASSGWRWQKGFPGGTQLLDYLYRRGSEADDVDAPMLRFLFSQAVQPYLRHMHAWAFTVHAVSPEFGTAGDKELLTLDFLPPPERGPGALVPVDPPAFLQPLHAAFMRAGSQLRLLASLESHGRSLAQQLTDVADGELLQRQLGGTAGAATAPCVGGGNVLGAAAHLTTSFSAVPEAAAAGAADIASLAEPAGGGWFGEAREPWISLTAAAGMPGGASSDNSLDLQMSSESLQQAVQLSQQRDAVRTASVDGWLGGLSLQRRLAEHAAFTEQLGRVVAHRERAAEQAARQAAALSRQQSAKSALLQEQAAAVAERRARRAAEQAQQDEQDRQLQAQAALRHHSAAVAELEQALSRAGFGGRAGRLLPTTADARAAPGKQAAAAVAEQQQQQQQQQAAPETQGMQQPPPALQSSAGQLQRPPALPPMKTEGLGSYQQHHQQQQENSAPFAVATARTTALSARTAGGATRRQPLTLGPRAVPPFATAAPEPLLFEASAELQHQLALPSAAAVAAAAEGADAAQVGGGKMEESEDSLAPLSAVLETCVNHSVLSQYRAVSRACVRLFLDEYKILEHLEALRRFFFQGAGDWAEVLVARLGAQADSLLPLASHQADRLLEDAARGTSAESDPYATHLRIKLLPAATSAIQAQVSAMHSPTPTRRARSFWSSSNTVQLAPTQLDALDCVALDYQVGWPLSAILTEDTLQGYSAVFSMMTRLRRVEQLLRGLAPPLAAQVKSSRDLLLSEDDADKAHRRIQALRAFRSGAAQFVASLQAFLQARTSGDAWLHLLAKLMVSSEEVAAAVVSRQPSAPMTGLLSRMNSLGPAGKAAHKLAQQLARALSSGSLPGSPRGAAAGGGGRLSRLNSLLSGAAGSAASSAVNTPREEAAAAALPASTSASAAGRQMSRFASKPAASGAPMAAGGSSGNADPQLQASEIRQQQAASGASSPSAAATVGGGAGAALSTQSSLGAHLLGQAAEQAADELDDSSGQGPDAAAWVEHFQRSQQGIADLQELLDLHRRYIRQASEDCLTFGGSEAVRAAVDGCLQCLLGFALRLQGTVRSGAGRRPQDTWTQSLRLDATWRPLAASMADFEERVQQLQVLLAEASSKSVLGELLLDFNGYYAKRRQQQQRKQQAMAALQQRQLVAGGLQG